MVRLAEKLYNITTLEATILISQRFFYQIYAEQYLELLLDLGVIDVGFFYECEKQWGDTATFISLSSAVDMSDPTMKTQYALVCHSICICFELHMYTAILIYFTCVLHIPYMVSTGELHQYCDRSRDQRLPCNIHSNHPFHR